jgi:hypothetical protein
VSPERKEWVHGPGDEQPPQLGELEHLYARLSPAERDELLECLLVAAPRGGEAMIKVLEDTLLCHATEEMLGGPLEGHGILT